MLGSLKQLFIGKPKNPHDLNIFHRMSLIAVLAWVGLGADGLSSSCYGPEAAYLALGEHKYLAIFVAILSAVTILLISASYSQIIELFPSGGGGYLVASKLINPTVGMISGCALLIDYVLTIAISIASGADALFSFLPAGFLAYKLSFEIAGVFLLMVMNMRGVKESVVPLTPIFMTFIVTHAFAIGYAIYLHANQLPGIITATSHDVSSLQAGIGAFGILFIILKAFSLGAGTFTGIEAVSNGLPVLREPKVKTGKKTMMYMAASLAITVVGLIIGYLLFDVQKVGDKTLNASLFEQLTHAWASPWGYIFVMVALISETMLLFVAAQAGYLDGPRVLASMAVDRWAPSRFSSFSDRLVTQNGIVLMGISSLIILAVTQGSVAALVILYSINVFITFCLSQWGMVVHWWQVRREESAWIKKIIVNGSGLLLTGFILVSMVILKFHEGGWITLAMTVALACGAWGIRKHYRNTLNKLRSLSPLTEAVQKEIPKGEGIIDKPSPDGKTVIILVNGYNGLGLHTLFNTVRIFKCDVKNFIFIQIGVIDAETFRGKEEMEKLKTNVENDLQKYEQLMQSHGYYAKGYCALGTDVALEIEQLVVRLRRVYDNCIVFGGQVVFERESLVNRFLHNHTVFAVHKRLYYQGIPMMVLPVRI